MMPKEKAQELINKFTHNGSVNWSAAKKDALICVDEILKLELTGNALMMYGMNYVSVNSYYSQVKDEINKL